MAKKAKTTSGSKKKGAKKLKVKKQPLIKDLEAKEGGKVKGGVSVTRVGVVRSS